jgi:hypothetical protein
MRDARKPQYDYGAEADIRAACDRAGVLEAAQADFIDEYRAGRFARNEVDDWIDKSRESKPQRWAFGGKEDAELFVRAFGEEPSLTAQGQVVAKYGEARAAEIAAQFATKVGSMKPGKSPEYVKKNGNSSDHSGNPFNKLRNADGTINKSVETEVAGLIKRLGTKKAEAIAAAAGKTLSGLPLRT